MTAAKMAVMAPSVKRKTPSMDTWDIDQPIAKYKACSPTDTTANVNVKFDDARVYADRFRSRTICIHVGRQQTPYYLPEDKLLENTTFLSPSLRGSIKGLKIEGTTVRLESPLFHEGAFQLFAEFLYRGLYTPSSSCQGQVACILHCQTYLLAGRIGFKELGAYSFEQLVKELDKWDPIKVQDPAFKPKISNLDPQIVVGMIKLIYTYTGILPSPKEEAGVIANPESDTTQSSPSAMSSGAILGDTKMRKLISRYAVSCLSVLERCPEFIALVRDGGAFAVDMMSATTYTLQMQRQRDKPETKTQGLIASAA